MSYKNLKLCNFGSPYKVFQSISFQKIAVKRCDQIAVPDYCKLKFRIVAKDIFKLLNFTKYILIIFY